MSERKGYTGKILFVDLTSGTHRLEERDEPFWRVFVGGGLLGTKLLLEGSPPGADALGGDNVLVFASSVLAGNHGPGLARFATVAKSPLTGGIAEAITEGPFAHALKESGADAIAIRGTAPRPTTLVIDDGSVHVDDATELWGRDVPDAASHLERRYGSGIHTAIIGPAGENLVRYASILTNRSFHVRRMGLGAVMGSKNLKAVVIRSGNRPPVHDQDKLNEIGNSFREQISANDLSRWQYERPGFSCWIYLHGLDAALCVDNYQKSTFEHLESYSAEQFLEHEIVDLPCPSCPNNCIKAIAPHAREHDLRSYAIHQEVTGTLGPNVGNGSLEALLDANLLCNRYGLDPTSLGFTISFAMELFERGILKGSDWNIEDVRFGDHAMMFKLIEDIVFRRGLGDVLAEGTKRAAEVIGGGAERYAMQVKGQEMVPFEPRSQTNLAMGYAVAPVGPRYDICEHDWDFDTEVGWEHSLALARTIGLLDRIPMGYVGIEKVRNFKALLTLWSAADAYLYCIFAIAPTRILSLATMADMLEAVTGWETSSHEIMRAGERRLHLMRWFNCREGLTPADDTLPQRFFEEAIEHGPRTGDRLDKDEFTSAIRDFYAMIGWDENGVPTRQTLFDHHLESVLS